MKFLIAVKWALYMVSGKANINSAPILSKYSYVVFCEQKYFTSSGAQDHPVKKKKKKINSKFKYKIIPFLFLLKKFFHIDISFK